MTTLQLQYCMFLFETSTAISVYYMAQYWKLYTYIIISKFQTEWKFPQIAVYTFPKHIIIQSGQNPHKQMCIITNFHLWIQLTLSHLEIYSHYFYSNLIHQIWNMKNCLILSHYQIRLNSYCKEMLDSDNRYFDFLSQCPHITI